MERVDCHCHTVFSDGMLAPEALLTLAQKRGLTGLSITDHDGVGSYALAAPLAQTLGLALLPGIEISAHHQKTSVHVLGYAFDLQHPEVARFCDVLQQKRLERNQIIIACLSRLKIPITLEALQARFPHSLLGRAHIAHWLVEEGYVSSHQKAFDRYLGDRARCFTPGSEISVEGAIDFIHRVGGYAVLAHPHAIRSSLLLSTLLSMPFDGIEAYYGPHPPDRWLAIAHQKGWLVTGGSDYHGPRKGYESLGSAWTPPEYLSHLWARYQANVAAQGAFT